MVSMNNKRRDRDVMKIMVSGYKVELPDETKMSELIVDFPGPQDSPYVGVSTYSFKSDQSRQIVPAFARDVESDDFAFNREFGK